MIVNDSVCDDDVNALLSTLDTEDHAKDHYCIIPSAY